MIKQALYNYNSKFIIQSNFHIKKLRKRSFTNKTMYLLVKQKEIQASSIRLVFICHISSYFIVICRISIIGIVKLYENRES